MSKFNFDATIADLISFYSGEQAPLTITQSADASYYLGMLGKAQAKAGKYTKATMAEINAAMIISNNEIG